MNIESVIKQIRKEQKTKLFLYNVCRNCEYYIICAGECEKTRWYNVRSNNK